MELNVSELYELNDNMYDEIPENSKKVRFSQAKVTNPVPVPAPAQSQTKSAIKKVTRPQAVEQKSKLTYDDILSKMGMFVAEGQLHLLDNQPLEVQQQIKNQIKGQKSVKQEQYEQYEQQPNQNSYIYNKYFSNETQSQNTGPRVPRSLQEYRNMLLQDLIQKQRVKQMKSTKLLMPTSNINFAPYSSQNMNKLFSFSNR